MDTPLCKAHLIEAWAIVDATREALLDRQACEAVPVAQRGPRGLRGPRRSLPTSVVYYVRVRDGVVKIGYTSDLTGRRTSLRVPWRDVLAVEPGGPEREAARHAEFASLRRGRREDFEASVELLAHIDLIRARWGDPQDIARAIRRAALAS